MKKTGIIAGLVTAWCIIAACGGASSDQPGKDTTAAGTGTENKGSSAPPRAVELIAGSDCLTCHKVRDKLIGPSYEEIAKKYTSKDIDTLASKIIKGGSGNFGSVPMTAHPSIPKEDAKEMVKYILSIK
jgi:cytochrome c